MRKDYKTLTTLSLKQKKDYLLSIDYQEEIFHCMSVRELNLYIENPRRNKDVFIKALHALYTSKNYDDLEYHIIMMNDLFHYQCYEELKKDLLEKICKKTITINEYCVIRHLVHFKDIPFQTLIHQLHHKYDTDEKECAKICLLEDQHQLAYQYLKKLDNCNDSQLLDLLSSYSLLEYASLAKGYMRKQKQYPLATTH